MRLWLLWCVCAAMSACSLSRAGAWVATTPLRVPIVGAPLTPHEDVNWRTDDGLTLRGWLFRPEGSPRALVVLLHGKDINRQHLSGAADRLRRRGFLVLAYDQRGHGNSEGTITTFGAKEVRDLQRVLDDLRAAPVYLVGESLGAAVALQAAARDPRIRSVVAGASFAELSTILAERSPLSPSTTASARAAAEQQWGFSADSLSPARDAPNIHVPVLLLHGSEDTFVKPAHSYRIYAALAGAKRLVLLEGVGHVDILLHERVWQLIESWLEQVADATQRPSEP